MIMEPLSLICMLTSTWTIPENVDNEKQNKICVFFLLKIKLGKRSEAKDGINIKCFVEKPFEILRIFIMNLRILLCLSGINRTALREIKLLQEISHENIIGVSAYTQIYF